MLFPLPLRAALILYHIQNCLSSTFFKFFQKFFCVALSCETALILYHFLFFLSSAFSSFFKKFFVISSALLRQLNYYITFSFLCQALFKKFFQLVSVFLPEWTSLTSSLLINSLQSKSNILLTLSHGTPALNSNAIIYLFLVFVK